MLAVCWCTFAFGFAGEAAATDPTTLSDNPADGTTLREAIDETPANGQIKLAAGTYLLTLGAGAYDDSNASGDLDITKPLTITGQGMNATTIRSANPGPVDGVFHVLSTLNVSDLTVADGVRPVPADAAEQRGVGAGGGFRVGSMGGASGVLVATRVRVSGNQAFQGGGVFVSGSSPTRSSAKLTESVIVGNSASNFGGGVSAYGDVTLDRTSVIENRADNLGGGLMLWASPRAELTATNTTIGDNQADGNGGGLDTGGNVHFDFSTLAGNVAGRAGRALQFEGGSVGIRGSLIAAGADGACAGNGPGDITSNGFNIDEGHSCLPVVDANADGVPEAATAGDRIDVPAGAIGLLALSPTAGVVWFGLGAGSAAVDTGPVPCLQRVDQRGVARPQNGRCDVGAIEQEPAPTPAPTPSSPSPTPGPATVTPTPSAEPTVTATPAPLQRMHARFNLYWLAKVTRFTTITRAEIARVPARSTIRWRCTTRNGHRCGDGHRRTLVFKNVGGTVRIKGVSGRYRAGTRFDVTVSNPRYRTSVFTATLRRKAPPRIRP